MIRKAKNNIVWYEFEELEERGVPHAFLTRLGGVSAPPFDTLNLGHTVGDDPAAVEKNHDRVFTALEISREQVVSPFQVHGTQVRPVSQAHGGSVQYAIDGLLTATPSVALLLRFADCVPILLFDPTHRAIAVVHSGWKGTAGNIAAVAVEALVRYAESRPEELWAGIGPAIGPCCYEVGQEMAKTASQIGPEGARALQQREGARRPGGLYLDLPGLVQAQLAAAGVKQITMSGICTACQTDEWFSHRAENGRTGRFGALAMLG
jgi:YfiH family protein